MSPQQTIAHYRLSTKLGEGGMGEVYRATDTKLHRDVAIKVLPETFAHDGDRLARFTREAQVLASLNHPNIAAIYGVEERALVMELVEGNTLAGPVSVDVALPLIHQLIDALEYAHEKGIIHRDLKPANIKVTPEGRLKVLDFGLAKAMQGEAAAPPASAAGAATVTIHSTQPGMIMGTAAYMSPEQARGQSVDRRSDIWAFGVVVHELLTGRQLFGGPSASDTLAAVLTRDPNLDAVPMRFRRLLRSCLMRDARQRLRDISGARILLDDDVASGPVSRRRPRPWMAAAAFLGMAACTFAYLWYRAASGSPVVPIPIRFTMEQHLRDLLSPDGKMILSAGSGLMIRPLNGVSWRQLPGTENASDAFWSPDSSSIGFFADGALRVIKADGSDPRTLAPVPDPHGGAWRGSATTGTILFIAADRFQVLDLSTGKINELPLRVSKNERAVLPVFLPEGDGFVYLLESGSDLGPDVALFRSSLSSGSASGERLLSTANMVNFARHPQSGAWHIFYQVPGTGARGALTLATAAIDPLTGVRKGEPATLVESVASMGSTRYGRVSVGANGMILYRRSTTALPIWHLTWFDRNGNVTGHAGETGATTSFAMAPDESRIAVVQGYPNQRVWIYDVASGKARQVSEFPGIEDSPVWSGDGKTLYYTSDAGSSHRVVRQVVDGTKPPEILFLSGQMLLLHDISPDGKLLVTEISRRGRGPILGLDITGDKVDRKLKNMVEGWADSAYSVRVSPDGHSLVITTQAGAFAVRYPPAGERPRRIETIAGATKAFFSRDGQTLYFATAQSIIASPVLRTAGAGLRLGERSVLFRTVMPTGLSAKVASAGREGNRFLVLSTDMEEEARTQLLSDWTTLLKP